MTVGKCGKECLWLRKAFAFINKTLQYHSLFARHVMTTTDQQIGTYARGLFFFFFSVLFCKILYFSYFSHCQKLIISSITFWLKWETIYLRLTHMISANKREKKGDRLEVGADCGVVTLYSISILWKVKHYSFERWSLLLLLCPIIHRPLFYSILFYFLFVLTSFSVHFNFSPRCFW